MLFFSLPAVNSPANFTSLAVRSPRLNAGHDPVPADGISIEAYAHRGGLTSPTDTRLSPILQQILSDPSTVSGNEAGWTKVAVGKGGKLPDKETERSWILLKVHSDNDQVVDFESGGNSLTFVNGEPFAGDPYGAGYLSIPIAIHAGDNSVLTYSGYGGPSLQFLKFAQPVSFDSRDTTLPDIIANPQLVYGKSRTAYGSILIRNAEAKTVHAEIRARAGAESESSSIELPPLTTVKAPFHFKIGQDPKLHLELHILDPKGDSAAGDVASTVDIHLETPKPTEAAKITFQSEIDGSTQYYAVLGPMLPPKVGQKPALVLSLHGASVEAIGQARAVSYKPWALLVCPTNRRPYGFDWENWGQQDALEVLHQAESHFAYDPSRVYLTGHSMGGHGTWRLGAVFPGMWAAIGPSAGWISAYTYAGATKPRTDGPYQAFSVAAGQEDTLNYLPNYANEGVYILHGEADKTVPVTEAKDMLSRLPAVTPFLDHHFQPGADHWWDASPEPGADCVDYAPMWDFFQHLQVPDPMLLRRLNWVTFNPAVNGKYAWAQVIQQTEPLQKSVVDLSTEPLLRVISGTTENVSHLRLDLSCLSPAAKSGDSATLNLDGGKLSVPMTAGWVDLQKSASGWELATAVPANQKNPQRYGTFKESFNHNMVLVYGTSGTPEENTMSLAKARFDEETWWVRGNGWAEMIPDTEYSPAKYKGRTVVLYGGPSENLWWHKLGNDSVKMVGTEDAMLSCEPMKDDAHSMVIRIGWTDAAGSRLLNILGYLMPMNAFPDFSVYNAHEKDALARSGIFGLDWSPVAEPMAAKSGL